jgi:tRNA pseudouridine38-40 synthase
MVRYQAILAYDGTEFQGFQRQAQARTVQGVVESALQKLDWQGSTLLAAGRTDTGVHAAGQVIAFDLEWVHSPDDLMRALNANLPSDVAVRQVMPASPTFHPRYDAISRRYRYHIVCEAVRNPLSERYAWRVWPVLDLSRLQDTASRLVGSHDFVAFGKPAGSGSRTVRTVTRAVWFQEGPYLVFEIVSRAFLYHMVRRLVSFQVDIAQGRHEIGELIAALDEPEGEMIPGLAPAHGLVLKEVCYSHKQPGEA